MKALFSEFRTRMHSRSLSLLLQFFSRQRGMALARSALSLRSATRLASCYAAAGPSQAVLSQICRCQPEHQLSLQQQQVRFYAKGKGNAKNKRSPDRDDEASHVPVMSKKGKKKGFEQDEPTEVGDMSLPGEQFDLRTLEDNMKHSIDRLRIHLNKLISRVGRIRPGSSLLPLSRMLVLTMDADLLDDIRVTYEDEARPLREFANVTVKDGRELWVTVYDEGYLRAVTQAIQTSPLGLNPQHGGNTTVRVPISKPDWDKRQQLVREASHLCENARVSIRAARHQGQKEIKHDVDNKVIGKEEGRSETKKVSALLHRGAQDLTRV